MFFSCDVTPVLQAIGAIALLEHRDGSSLTINVEYNQLDPLLRATINKEGDVNDVSGETFGSRPPRYKGRPNTRQAQYYACLPPVSLPRLHCPTIYTITTMFSSAATLSPFSRLFPLPQQHPHFTLSPLHTQATPPSPATSTSSSSSWTAMWCSSGRQVASSRSSSTPNTSKCGM